VPGYVRVTADEVVAIAAHLGMPRREFVELCTRPTTDRPGLSLAENPDGACMFLRPDNRCDINPVKPQQCRDFPGRWRFPEFTAVCPACSEREASGESPDQTLPTGAR
jgi:Fe-S-cluster containining protein